MTEKKLKKKSKKAYLKLLKAECGHNQGKIKKKYKKYIDLQIRLGKIKMQSTNRQEGVLK